MSKISPPSPLPTNEYEAIESALLESVRGRWFLAEFSRRNRTADTQMLLEAITKLEAAFIQPQARAGEEGIRHQIIEMSEAISQTRREIAAITAPHEDSQLITATEELDAIVQSTEKATSDILEAAEDIQEAAWVLREKEVDSEICDRLDERATDIYTACSFQDITGQRTSKVVNVLRFLESRVNSMVNIWGLDDIEVHEDPVEDERPDAHLLNGPQLDGEGLGQCDIDEMIGVDSDDLAFVEDGATQEISATAEADAAQPETAGPPPGTVVGKVSIPAPSAETPGEQSSTAAGGEFTLPDELDLMELDAEKKAALFS